jgi:hypothetical protein
MKSGEKTQIQTRPKRPAQKFSASDPCDAVPIALLTSTPVTNNSSVLLCQVDSAEVPGFDPVAVPLSVACTDSTRREYNRMSNACYTRGTCGKYLLDRTCDYVTTPACIMYGSSKKKIQHYICRNRGELSPV